MVITLVLDPLLLLGHTLLLANFTSTFHCFVALIHSFSLGLA
ncbi:putative membrane protein [Synechococcus sp. PROS-9-1]|nr:putative membrane protein [Synechococcus sp. PROS-9-1]